MKWPLVVPEEVQTEYWEKKLLLKGLSRKVVESASLKGLGRHGDVVLRAIV